mgnify:CR=1 FL=1
MKRKGEIERQREMFYVQFGVLQTYAQMVLACQRCYNANILMMPHISEALHALLQDKGVRLAISRGFEYELNDSAT